VMKTLLPLHERTAAALAWRSGVGLALSLLGALLVHHGVELPCQRLLTRRRTRTHAAPAPYPDETRARELARVAS